MHTSQLQTGSSAHTSHAKVGSSQGVAQEVGGAMFTHRASPHTRTPTSNEVNSYFLRTYFTGMLLSYSHTHYIYTQAYLLEVLIAYLFSSQE